MDPTPNISHIRVAGVGGLGLVAMALFVAAYVPGIRVSLIVALVSGVLLAVGLILWRRSGPLPSSGQRPGASTVLALESDPVDPPAPRSEPKIGADPHLRMA